MRTQEYFVSFKDEWDACREKDTGKTGEIPYRTPPKTCMLFLLRERIKAVVAKFPLDDIIEKEIEQGR